MPTAILLRFYDCRRDIGHIESVRLTGSIATAIADLAEQARLADDADERLARLLDRAAKDHAPADYDHDETDGWDDADRDATDAVIVHCHGRFDRFDSAS